MLQPALPFEQPDNRPIAEFHNSLLRPRPVFVQPVGPIPVVVDFVRHPRAKRYVIRVRADGSVRVTIPRGGSRRAAQAFVAGQRTWIEKQRHEAAARPVMRPEIERALRERAGQELPVRLQQLAASLGLTVSRVSIRSQRRRWGSCSPHGHICLNWRLVTVPDWVRDYVLIHELMHLRRLDHSPAFWALVERACPEYRRARAWLTNHA